MAPASQRGRTGAVLAPGVVAGDVVGGRHHGGRAIGDLVAHEAGRGAAGLEVPGLGAPAPPEPLLLGVAPLERVEQGERGAGAGLVGGRRRDPAAVLHRAQGGQRGLC